MADLEDLDPEALRARFAELKAESDALSATVAGLRETRDAKVATHIEELTVLDDEIKAAEAPLIVVDNARARISRFLDGKTGS